MYYIGIDLGTSAVKLLLMEANGHISNSVSIEYPLYFPHPGWSEQHPEDWWKAVCEGIIELTKDIEREKVAGISFGGQMHGLVILDEEDKVIRPAILWNDGRSTKETDYLNHVIGKDKLSEYTANIAFAGFTAPKILWVKENEPDNFKRINKIMLPKDYIAYRLSGTFCTDVSDASGMLLFDVKNKRWSKEMLEICHITEEQLPKIFESYEIVGTLKPELADTFGLSHNVKIVAGAADNAAAAVGTGTVGDGMCNISLGTSGTIFISSKNFGVDKYNALHAFAHADGYYHLLGCMLSAASCNKWWMDEIIGTKDYATEQAKITKLGENKVFFLPYLYSIPFDSTTIILFYRKDIFDKYKAQMKEDLGFEANPGSDYFTWDQYIGVARWMKEHLDESEIKYPSLTMSAKHNSIYTAFSTVLGAYGGNYFTNDKVYNLGAQTGFEIQSRTPEFITALKKFKEIVALNSDKGQGYSWDQVADIFAAGEVAMMINWDENISAVENSDIVAGKVGYSTLPRGSIRSANIYGGSGIGINSYSSSKKKLAAWMFIVWATSPQIQMKAFLDKDGGTLPTRTALVEKIEEVYSKEKPQVVAMTMSQKEDYVYYRPKIRKGYEFENILVTNLYQMVHEEQSTRSTSIKIKSQWSEHR